MTLDAADIETIVAPPLPARAAGPDGWIHDVETGEVLGLGDLPERFEVRTREDAEWVLELRSRIEGEIAALDARLAALTSNLRALRQEQVRRLSWWEYRFGPSLAAFARSILSGRSRTARFAWGSVAVRTSKGAHEVLDPEAAVAFVEAWEPARVKVARTVGVTDVLAALETAARASGEEVERPSWLRAAGPQETVKIETGVGRPARTTEGGRDET